MRIGRPSVLREANALRTLALLREVGQCSRAHLARTLGLSAPTITSVIRDLLAGGLVEELGEGPSNGGRPPGMLRFRAEYGCLLGVQVTAAALEFFLTDLDGTELAARTVRLRKAGRTPTAVADTLAETARELLAALPRKRRKLVAAVVAVPAIVAVDTGTVLSVSTLDGWRTVPLGPMLEERLGCLVIIENDTNLAAAGEQLRGAARGVESFILVSIGDNVSAGILLGNRIHHGAQWSAGEVGYLRLPRVSRRKATLHQFGALEEVLTASGLERSWAEARAGARRKTARAGAEGETSASTILDLAHHGDARALRIVRHLADMLSDLVMNLSLILNPALVVLDGTVGRHPALAHAVEAQLATNEFGVPRLRLGELGQAASLWGAIALGMEAAPPVLLGQGAEVVQGG